jgi:hypothetical protein
MLYAALVSSARRITIFYCILCGRSLERNFPKDSGAPRLKKTGEDRRICSGAKERPWRNWIAHRSSEPRVGGSNPPGRTYFNYCRTLNLAYLPA